MSRILVNAVSAKHGGARTIVESLIAEAGNFDRHEFIVLAGFENNNVHCKNVTFYCRPKSGISAMLFSLFFVLFSFFKYRADILISFNNVNTLFLPNRRKLTYFHQLKALDARFIELKLSIIRLYMRFTRETVIVQSQEVRRLFFRMFSGGSRSVIVAWPGINPPEYKVNVERKKNRVIVPLSNIFSRHKNFDFVNKVALSLKSEFDIIVTAADDPSFVKLYCDNISFIGVLSREQLFEEYQTASVCLFASTHETVGLPVFEALSVGLPVVAFDAPYARAFREYFEISEGWWLASTPEEAANHIRFISQRPDQIVVSNRSFTQSDWEKIIKELPNK